MSTHSLRSLTGFAAALLLAACATPQTVTVCERAAGACGAKPPPIAQAQPPRKAPVRYADANHDGKVTREEAQADRALAAAFDTYDKNGDGVLDPGEFAQLEADSNRRHPRQRQEFAAAEETPLAETEKWRCHEVNRERICPGARPRVAASAVAASTD